MTDFRITDHGTVVSIEAVTDAAIEFAGEVFTQVQAWQGYPENFTTDWRAGQDIVNQLQADGFTVAVR